MVKLADTPDLGSGALGVRVQVPSLAYSFPIKSKSSKTLLENHSLIQNDDIVYIIDI